MPFTYNPNFKVLYKRPSDGSGTVFSGIMRARACPNVQLRVQKIASQFHMGRALLPQGVVRGSPKK